MRPQFRQQLQQVMLFALVLVMVIAGTSLRLINWNPRLIVGGLSLVMALWALRQAWRHPHKTASPLDWGWLALIGTSFIGVIVSDSSRRSLEIWAWTLAVILPLYTGVYALLRSGWPLIGLRRAILGAGLYVLSLSGLFISLYLIEALTILSADGTPPPFRLFGVLDNPSILGMFLAITVPIAISTWTIARRKIGLTLWLLAAAVTTIAHGTRSAFLATMTGIAVTLVLLLLAAGVFKRVPRRLVWGGSLLMVIVGALGIAGVLVILSRAPGHADPAERLGFYQMAFDAWQDAPLTGYGVGGFMTVQLERLSIPGFKIVPHAHNQALNLLVDVGAFGLIGLLIFVGVALWVTWRAWMHQPDERRLLAGMMGGLTGFAASGVLDVPMNQPALFFLAALLLAGIAAHVPLERASRPRALVMAVPGVMIAAQLLLLLMLYAPIWNAIPAANVSLANNAAAWRDIARQMDAALITDPHDPLKHLQAARAEAEAALIAAGPSGTYEDAAQRYAVALQYDPLFGLHHLNRAYLHHLAGNGADALSAAENAVELAPRDPVALMFSAQRLEVAGELEAARQRYRRALNQNPRWAFMDAFWTATPTRQGLNANLSSTTYLFYDNLYRGDRGDYEAARAYTSGNIAPLQERLLDALIRHERGENVIDELSALADAFNTARHPLQIDTRFYLGDALRQQGRVGEALNAYTLAYGLTWTYGIDSLPSAGDTTYSQFRFWRFGLVSDYLPGLRLPEIPDAHLERVRWLLERLQNTNPTGAARIRDDLARVGHTP